MQFSKKVFCTYIWLKLHIRYRDFDDVLEKQCGYAKILSNFGNSGQ
jgi:hypothetical protein